MELQKGSKVIIKSISLEYSDYQNIRGEVIEIEGDLIKVTVPIKSFSEEDERELLHENGFVFVKVKQDQIE